MEVLPACLHGLIASGRTRAPHTRSCLTCAPCCERPSRGAYEAVARVERGTAIPTVVRLAELAELFGCPTSELLMESSTVTVDQAAEVVKVLGRVPLADRQLLVRWLGEFADRLSTGK